MFEKILVALDRSSEASAVFDYALSVAEPETSQMLAIHFIDWQMQDVSPWIGLGTLYDVDLSGDRFDWSRERLQQEIERSQDWLATYASQAISKEIDCETECRVGNCNIGVIDRAKEWGADLIIIGRRGHKNISEILLGSVSNYVIHHASCSVLVVRGTKNLNSKRSFRATKASS